MNFSKLKYMLCLLFLWLGMQSAYSQETPDKQITVKGKVVDENKAPMPGVNVYLQESKASSGINTGADGSFSI